jgi:hypothetical protein
MKHVTWILCLYPQRWRQRYEEEMLVLLEQHTVTLATLFDLLLGALDARLDPSYKTEKPLFLFKDERMIATTFLCAYAVFLFAMYNWHHYIPLSLSLTPYYRDMGLSSLTSLSSISFVSSSGLGGVSSDSLLAASDLVMQGTLLASNLFLIALLIKQAGGMERKRLVLPAILCLVLLFTLPMIPLLAVSASTSTFTSTSGTVFSVEIRPLGQIVNLYMWSFRLLWPLLTLLISSLFIVMVRIREIVTASRKHWLLIVVLFCLILPVGRMLWLNNSVQIPSTIVPISAIVLGTMLTYFPPFAGLTTMILAVATSEGSKRVWRVALLPATLLSLVMLAKIILTFITLPLILHSMLRTLSPYESLSVFIFTMMLLVMFVAGGIALLALMRGFVALRTTESYTQNGASPPLAQSL